MSRDINYQNLKALLLDLDGTLINSEKYFFESYAQVLKKYYGVDITKEEYIYYELEQNAKLLPYKRQSYQQLINAPDQEIFNLLYERYQNCFDDIISEQDVYDTFDLIKQIKLSGLSVSLITTSKKMYLDMLFKKHQLDNIFDVVVSRDDVEHSLLKPNSYAYNMALAKINIEPQYCLAIEDSKRGIDAALGAQIPTVKVSNYSFLKYEDNRVIEEPSAQVVLQKILKSK